MPEGHHDPGYRAHEPRVPARDAVATLSPSPGLWILAVSALLLLAVALFRSAWLCDDAFITLRCVDNIVNGLGPRWNVVERVQPYTHPLWMMLLVIPYAITREPAFTTLAVSLACTAAVVALLFRRLPPGAAIAATLLLASSRAFVDYSTSGLENPLSHLLLVAFALEVLGTSREGARGVAEGPAPQPIHPLRIGLLAALLTLTRMDFVLMVAPALLVLCRRLTRRAALGMMAAAAAPVAAWHLFTLIYYGFPFPNTAYAKLGHGYTAREMVPRGVIYLQESLSNDPVTLLVVLFALAAVVARRTMPRLMLGCGLVLHLAYVVWVGGDYMSGRFLTPTFALGVTLLASTPPAPVRWRRLVPAGVAAAMLVSLLQPSSPLRLWSPLPKAVGLGEVPGIFTTGIINERAYYYAHTGLIPMLGGVRVTQYPWSAYGVDNMGIPHAIEYGSIGMLGFYGGPTMHLLDPNGLGDPVTARLPALPAQRTGHFLRALPDGYLDTYKACMARLFPRGRFEATTETCLTHWNEINRFRDPAIAHAAHELFRITQAPLFDRDRLWTILRWNLHLSGFDRSAAVQSAAGAAGGSGT